MSRKNWTVLFLSDEGDDLRQFRFGAPGFKRLVGGAATLCVALVASMGVVGYQAGNALRHAQLERENRVLVGELSGMTARVFDLEGDFERLSDKDAELRILAGLEGIDAEVMQVGVGGPGIPQLDDNVLFPIDPDIAAEAFAVSYDLNALERRSRLLTESMLEASDSLAAHRDLLESTPSILPANGLLTSRFSNARLHPIYNEELPHEGVDISAPRGTPIMASAHGRVTSSGRQNGYGLVVELDHGYGYSTLYGHASEILVRPGQEVERGEVIARVGATGTATTPHVHYEIRVAGRPVNPMNYVIAGALP